MAIENTPLIEELVDIFTNTPLPPSFVWECTIVLPDKDVKVQKVISIDILRNYTSNFADEVIIKLSLPEGFFNSQVMANSESLIFELTRTPLGDSISDSIEPYVKRYKAIIQDESNSVLAARHAVSQDPDANDLSSTVEKNFQLTEVALEQIRVYETGGIFRDVVPGKVARYVLSHMSSQLDLSVKDTIKGVDMVEPDNTSVQTHVVIPHGTRVQDVPNVIQEEWGGIYNSGVGCYLQDNQWFLWPQYRVNRFSEEKRSLRIYNLPPKRYPSIEKTYRLNGSELVILSTGQAKHKDVSYADKLNYGNGTRFTSATRIWEGFGTTEANKFTMIRAVNNTEIKGIVSNDIDYAPVAPKRITDNSFSEASRLSRRMGSVVEFVWENSRIDLIYPGMPLKFYYLHKDEIKELQGVVVQAHHFIYDSSTSPQQMKHITNTALSIFVEQMPD